LGDFNPKQFDRWKRELNDISKINVSGVLISKNKRAKFKNIFLYLKQHEEEEEEEEKKIYPRLQMPR